VKTGASRFQEIQWLNEEILRLLSTGLQFSDIRVYAPDISVYVPIIEFIFDTVPFRIASVDLARQSGFYQSILQMFRCVSGRWEANYILELFKRPAFHRKMKWQQNEIDRMSEWIEIGRVRWGIDAAHKKETTAVEGAIQDVGSWKHGWDAMLNSLIYLQPDKESVIGWGEIDLFEKFYELFDDLQKTLLSWREEKTLHCWADEIEALIERTLDCDETLEADLVANRSFRQFIDGLRKTSRSFPEEKFPFSWIETHFYSTSSEEGRSILNAVRFTSLTPGTLLPAKALFLIGMDEESFPRLHTSSSFQNKLKDVPRSTDFDRYMFLQAIFCAKDKLVFTYGDSSKEDGKAMSPSLLLQELFGYLDNTFSFEDEKKPSDVLIAKGKIRELSFTESHSLIENTKQIPELVDNSEIVPIQELAKFFRHPLQYYLKQVLGIELREEPDSAWKDFELSALDRHFLLRNSLTQGARDFEMPAQMPTEMPIGMFGDLAKKNLCQDVDQFQEYLKSWNIDPASISTRSLSGNLCGEVPYCVPGGVLHLGADDIGGLLRKWPELLAALVATGATKIYCLRSGKVREIGDPVSALQQAIDLFVRCRKSPCFLHAEWADALLRKKAAPEMDPIKDRVLRWIIQRSPALDVAHEQKIWQELFEETFSALTALFPVRGQHAEV
jgi:exodeoxyribonuclease V gamma subunit